MQHKSEPMCEGDFIFEGAEGEFQINIDTIKAL
jgi:hypothetical protein